MITESEEKMKKMLTRLCIKFSEDFHTVSLTDEDIADIPEYVEEWMNKLRIKAQWAKNKYGFG